MLADVIKDGEHLFVTVIRVNVFQPVFSYRPVQMDHEFQEHYLPVEFGSITAVSERVFQIRDRTEQGTLFRRGDAQNIGVLLISFLETVTQIIIFGLICVHKIRRDVDDNPFIRAGIVYRQLIDISLLYQNDIIRF